MTASESSPRPLVPILAPHSDVPDREHDRHFDQDADDGRERRAEIETKQHDRGRDRQFKEIARPDQRQGATIAIGD